MVVAAAQPRPRGIRYLVEQISFQLRIRINIYLPEKARMARRRQSGEAIGSEGQSAFDDWRGCGSDYFVRARKMMLSVPRSGHPAGTRGGDVSEVSQDVRPQLRHEGTFVNPVDELSIQSGVPRLE